MGIGGTAQWMTPRSPRPMVVMIASAPTSSRTPKRISGRGSSTSRIDSRTDSMMGDAKSAEATGYRDSVKAA
jgi:hypothetical protein